MIVQWHDARRGRPSFYADVAGRRCFVEQTVRSHCAQGLVGTEYQASVAGVRLGEYPTLDAAKAAAIHAAETNTAPQDEPRGREDAGFDYREFRPAYDY